MSDAPAVQCDRCGKCALLELRVGLPEIVPGHWSTVRLIVARPTCDTGTLDLCEVCTPIVYNTICDKPRMLVNGKDPRSATSDVDGPLVVESIPEPRRTTEFTGKKDSRG